MKKYLKDPEVQFNIVIFTGVIAFSTCLILILSNI